MILAGRNLPRQQENNPSRFSLENKLETLGDVEVLLVQDSWPTNEDSIWSMKLLKVAVKITHCFTGK